MSTREDAPHDAHWRVLALIAFAELFGMSVWFTASAVSPQLRELWDLSAAQAGWLTTVVQLGFVAGTACAAVLNLADIFPARSYFAASALIAAAVNTMLVVAPSYGVALLLRFFTGFFLAGVYPPAMKMAATWFRTNRGLAIGMIVGGVTVGKATPYLVRALPHASVSGVVLTASAACVLGAMLIALLYRDGPYPFPRRPFSWGLVGVAMGNRPTRLAVGGYLGHMWELYAMWTLSALFLHDYFAARGASDVAAASAGGLVAFAVIGAGGLGSVLAGKWADRFGRERVTILSMAVSGCCALVAGWLLHASAWLIVPLCLVWGFAVVADSAQFSALVTELTPPHAVGTALTLQTSLGFLLSALTIWLGIAIETRYGWGWAFSMLAIGPALGILSMQRLQRMRGVAST
jgi:MFS family permease